MALDYTLDMGPGGKFSGAGTFAFSDDTGFLNGTLSFTGSLRSAANAVHASMLMKMNGSGQLDGYDVSLVSSVRETLGLDVVGHELVGMASGRVTVAVPGLGKHTSPI